jgi:hypothetical protein
MSVFFSPHCRGEKVAEGRMRGSNLLSRREHTSRCRHRDASLQTTRAGRGKWGLAFGSWRCAQTAQAIACCGPVAVTGRFLTMTDTAYLVITILMAVIVLPIIIFATARIGDYALRRAKRHRKE